MATHPCPGCLRITSRQGRCLACGGGTTTQRGYGAAWRLRRARQLMRHPLCQWVVTLPSTTCRLRATDVDHIVPKVHGGTDHAFDVSSGTERWSAAVGGNLPRGASASDGRVFIGSDDGHLNAFDAATGSALWAFPVPGCCATTAVRAGTVYVAGAADGDAGVLFAVDAATGMERWRYDAGQGTTLRSPSVDASAVYIATIGGPILALAVADGSLRWSFDGTSSSEAAVAIVGDSLYLFGDDPAAWALDAATGTKRWHLALDSSVDSGTAVADGRLLAGTALGEVLALGTRQGSSTPTSTRGPVSAAPSQPRVVGELVAPGGLDLPVDVAFDPQGDAWVTEGASGTFAIFGPDGTFLERWGSPGTASGQFDFAVPGSNDPSGTIRFEPDGGFWVGDAGNFRVQHFDSHRVWTGSFGRFGNDDGQFYGQNNVALAPDGRLFVLDGERNDIQMFDADGAYLRTLSEREPGKPMIDPVAPLVVGDLLFFADGAPYWNTVVVLDTDGTFVTTITSPEYGNLADLDLGQDGLIYAADWGGKVHVIDPRTLTAVDTWNVGPGWPDSTVQGLGVAPDGRVYAAERDKVQILEMAR